MPNIGNKARKGRPEPYEIRTARQLRAIGTPISAAIIEEMRLGGAMSAAEIAEKIGKSPQGVHYHLGKLREIGLVRVAGERDTGRRPEMLFEIQAHNVHLTQGKRTPGLRREMLRMCRLFLRRASEDYEAAVKDKADERLPAGLRLTRSVTQLSEADVEELAKKLEAISRWVDERDGAVDTDEACRVSFTVVLATETSSER